MDEILTCDHLNIKQHFPVVLSTMLYGVVLTF